MRLIDSTRLILESDGESVSLHDIVNAPTIEAKTEADVISAYNEGVAYGAEQAVRHGRWVRQEARFDGDLSWYRCSSCEKLIVGDQVRFNYCPNCGAKMYGGADNG